MGSLKVAVSQMPVAKDCRENSKVIQELMRKASEDGCTLIQFPEGALSGYAKEQVENWSDIDWIALEDELEAIKKAAKRFNIWVVVGSAYRLSDPEWPYNSLYVISAEGKQVARYDKRILSFTERRDWYSAGEKPVTFSVNGIKIGLALCIEIQFPEIFDAYRRSGADAVLLSAYSDNPMFGITAQAHASINTMWIGFCVPKNDKVQSALIGPDGTLEATPVEGLAVGPIDPSADKWKIPLTKARPWRQMVRESGYLSHDILKP
ncbi:MAG TPA: carbon-nitrogen hydrolase family protein [Verrucomicrobiae bacterium]|nr:carbon-nitrogen hydrolase family protein [Verrucomicrobiae bacterium]